MTWAKEGQTVLICSLWQKSSHFFAVRLQFALHGMWLTGLLGRYNVPLVTGNSLGSSTKRLISFGNQGWVGQTTTIMIPSTSSISIFFKQRSIRLKGGKPKKFLETKSKSDITGNFSVNSRCKMIDGWHAIGLNNAVENIAIERPFCVMIKCPRFPISINIFKVMRLLSPINFSGHTRSKFQVQSYYIPKNESHPWYLCKRQWYYLCRC